MRRARALIEVSNRRESDAIADLDAVLSQNPRDAEAYFARALAYGGLSQEQGETSSDQPLALSRVAQDQRAFGDLTEAIRLDPTRGEFYRERARAAARLRYFPRATADYTTAMELLPESKDILVERAVTYFKMNEFARAIRDYDEVIRSGQKTATVLLGRARTRLDANGTRYAEAAADYRTAIELMAQPDAIPDTEPGRSEHRDRLHLARLDLAVVLTNQPVPDQEGALAQYDAVIVPASVEAQESPEIAALSLEPAEHDAVLLSASRAGRVHPEILARAHAGRAPLLVAKQDIAGAIRDYSEVLKRHPEDVTARRARAQLYFERKEYADAAADFVELIKGNPRDAQALKNHARASMALVKYSQAIADYDTLIAINPRDAEAFLGRARARQLQGQREKALADFQVVLRLDPFQRDARVEAADLAGSPTPGKIQLLAQNLGNSLKNYYPITGYLSDMSMSTDSAPVATLLPGSKDSELLAKRQLYETLTPPQADFRASSARAR
ncbi:tetratricopeptide repeat protein [Tundrisphaera sp. TA3]|uniref:tetratricopeptide repeat protein n=1 Tax=Tundrisphaera sp. TA3 TaxID=3435775 RepID=UPI003EB7F5D8